MKKCFTIALALLTMLALPAGALAEGLTIEDDTLAIAAAEAEVVSGAVDETVGEEEQWIGGLVPADSDDEASEAREVMSTAVGADDGVLKTNSGGSKRNWEDTILKGDVEVLEGVAVIQTRAFDCYDQGYGHFAPDGLITSISLPNTLIRIEDEAFLGIGTSEGLKVNLPSSVIYIGNSAFRGSGLTSVTIPNSILTVKDSTFKDCKRLTSVTLPGSIAGIGNSAFAGCTALPSITLPDSVTDIGESAFEGCTLLTTVKLPANLLKINKATFKGDILLSNIALPDKLTGIGESAFEKCYSLRSVAVPEGVTAVSKYAFQDCQVLTSAVLPAGLESIEDFAFYNCTQLNSVNGAGSVEIPDGVTKIGSSAFAKDVSITKLVIGEEIEKIGEDAFNGCSQLKTVIINGHGDLGGRGAFNNIYPSAEFKINCDVKLADDLESKGYSVGRVHGNIEEDEAVPATCTEAGLTKGSHCADCGEVLVAQKEVPALGHKAVKDPAVAATFKKTGLTAGKHCSVCGEVLVEQQVVPKLSGSVELNKTDSQTLVIGKTLQLKATTDPSSYKSKLTWKSSKPKVASVSKKGKVKALAKGTTVITAKLPDGSGASVTVKVEAPKPKSLKVLKDGKKITKYTLKVGKFVTLSVNLSPKNAESKLTWKSSNTDVVTINANTYNNYVASIRAHKAGKATITVTAENNPKAKATIKITVKKK